MNRYFVNLTLLLSFSVVAEPINCLAAPSRTEPCENLVYRAVTDPNTEQTRLFCFCRQDFDRLFQLDVTDQEYMFNKMEIRQILAQTGYTEKQLKALIQR